MTRLSGFVFGAAALLTATAVGAQGKMEHYAKVGAWQIEVEPARKLCKMYRVYGSSVDDHIEALFVRYDATNESVSLRWSTNKPIDLPADGQIEFELNFVKGKSLDQSWGSRTFRYGKPADTYYFDHSFNGAKGSQRILRDLSKNALLGLYFGSTMMTGLLLDAADATQALRECSAKAGGLVAA